MNKSTNLGRRNFELGKFEWARLIETPGNFVVPDSKFTKLLYVGTSRPEKREYLVKRQKR